MLKKSLKFSSSRLLKMEYLLQQGQANLSFWPSSQPSDTMFVSRDEALSLLVQPESGYAFQVNESRLDISTVGNVKASLYSSLNQAQSLLVRYEPSDGYYLQLGWLDVTYLFGEEEWEQDLQHYRQTGCFSGAGLHSLKVHIVGQLAVTLPPASNYSLASHNHQ